MGVQSVDPPCTGAARIGDSGEQLPCVPCAAVPSHPTMCVWMREERNAESSTPHFKGRAQGRGIGSGLGVWEPGAP